MSVAKKIIYIDDDHDDSEIFEQIISEMDRKVMLITSGMHFFDFIYDDLLENSLIFVDLNLPKISGQEIILQLRKKFTPQQLPIIVFSGLGSQEIINQCYDCGANGFLIKSYDYFYLRKHIEEAVNCNWERTEINRSNFLLNAEFTR